MKLTVELDEESAAVIRGAVEAGIYETPEAAIQEAVWEWALARSPDARSRAEIDLLLEEAFRDLEENNAEPLTKADLEDVKRRGRERLAAQRSAAE